MWKRLPKYRTSPKLAPPTAHADKDGSFYRPPLAELAGRPKPNVPLAARTKSASRMVAAVEAKRAAKMSQQVKTNPLCYVSAIIERPPVVMRPMKSWELDMAVVQSKRDDEIETAIPPSIIKPTYEENPEWAVSLFKQVFREKADPLMPLVGPPKIAETALKTSATATSAADDQSKKKKDKAAKAAAKEAKKAGEAAPAAAAATESGASVVEKSAEAGKPVSGGADGWRKSFADMGIEFAEEKMEEQSMTKMHVELKTKQDDKQTAFQPSARITEADQKNDKRSLDRKLAEKLYLVVKRNGKWGFPSVKRTAEEGLLAAAQRAAFGVLDQSTRENDIFFVSACPMGYRPVADAKEFFLRAQLIHGDFNGKKCPQTVEDYMWLNPAEVADLFVGKDGDQDEAFYLKRMFGDDWWQDELDSDALSPIEDALAKKRVKDVPSAEQQARFKQEEQRRQETMQKMLGSEAAV